MTEDERLLCAPWNRGIFVLWQNGEISRAEAVFLARRVEFHCALLVLPRWLTCAILHLYEAVFEPAPGSHNRA